MRVAELVVGDAVAAEAAAVVAAEGDPLEVVEGAVEGDPLEVVDGAVEGDPLAAVDGAAEGDPLAVVDGAAEGDPLAVVDGAAEGDGEGIVPHELEVEVQSVAVLATARWFLKTGGVTLAARLGLAGGSNSSAQFRNCSVGRLGLHLIATG